MRNRQKVFINEYLQCWNATKAAQLAGYSEKTAYSLGGRLLKNVEVQTEITKRLKEKQMGADEVLTLLSEQARADVSDFVHPGGIIDWEAVRLKGRLVKKVKHTFGHPSEIELHDSQRALELIGKHHRLFADRLEIGGSLDVIGFETLLEKVYGSSKEETTGSEREPDKHGDAGG